MAGTLFDGNVLSEARDAMAFLAGVLEASTEYSIIGKGLDGTILLWNEGARRMYGYESDEVIGKANSDILHTPEDVAAGKPRAIMDAALRDGKWEGVIDRIRKDGRRLSARLVITPRRDAHGTLVGFLQVSKDISSELWFTEQIQKAKLFDSAIIGNAQEAVDFIGNILESSTEYSIIGKDLDGRILLWNEGARRLYGYEPEEVVGRAYSSILHTSEDVAAGKPREYMDIALRDGKWEGTIERVRKNGQRFQARAVTTPRRDASGRPIGFLLISKDISDEIARERTEHELINSERRFRAIAESARESIVTADATGAIVFWNPAAANLFGYDEREILGRPLTTLMPERYHTAHREGFARFLSTREAHVLGRTVELHGSRKDGTEFPIELSLSMWMLDEVVFFTGIIRDVSARQELERQLRQAQKMDAIGQLAAGVAHDFNNLLTVILGFSNFVMKTFDADDRRRSDLQQVIQAGECAATLTKQLLAFSRKQVLQPVAVNLNALVTGIRPMLGRLIGEHINLVTVLAPDLQIVRADLGQLEQIVMNLVVNARDAMPVGGRVAIETANVELDESYVIQHDPVRPGSYVMLAVSDGGIGMNEETKQRLFEPFFTTKELGKGTGMGLATVYGIVKQNGGYIWVHSEPGAGTTFKVYLPVADKDQAVPTPASSDEVTAAGTETVLVVEDEEAVRFLTRVILEKAGYRVFDAPNSQQAEALFEENPTRFDLLVTDVIMPGLSGPKLIARLAKLRPDLKVLYVSGYTDDAIVHQGQLKPGTEFLQKPFTEDELNRRVREVLDR